MSHPSSYTAFAFMEKGGSLQKVSINWKEPQEGHVVVKVLACGICGSDVLTRNQRLGTSLPRVPGHEIVGDVIAVHPSEKQWKVGQRVGSGWHGGHCGICGTCRSGDFNACDKSLVNGLIVDGGYAEYVTLRSEAICSVPEDMDPAEAAPYLCAGVTTFNSLRHMDAKPGDIVAVQGVGGLGHLAIQFARAMGFRVVAISQSESKRDLAIQLGATTYINASQENPVQILQSMGGAKVVACTAPNSGIIQSLISALTVEGQLLILAAPEDPATIFLPSLLHKRLSIRGWLTGSAKDCEETLEFAKQMDIKCMVQKFPLEKAQEAYDAIESARFRNVLTPVRT